MAGEREQFRFRETNRLIEAAFGRVGSILEIGCGEGHQSEHLMRLCDRLTGIDVSAKAIARARERLPRGQFEVASLAESRLARSSGPFDLVVAAEVLYYMADVPRCLDTMAEVGRTCFVTYYQRHAERLDQLMPHGAGRGEFSQGDTLWVARWWRNDV